MPLSAPSCSRRPEPIAIRRARELERHTLALFDASGGSSGRNASDQCDRGARGEVENQVSPSFAENHPSQP